MSGLSSADLNPLECVTGLSRLGGNAVVLSHATTKAKSSS